MDDDTFINPIERMRRIAEEFGVSRKAMDAYNSGRLMDYEIVVGLVPESEPVCLPCVRETLGDEKVDWILAQRNHDVTDGNGQTFRAIIWEPFDPILDCYRCGRPLKPGEPAERGVPVGVTQNYGRYSSRGSYCVEHAPVILGPELAARFFAPDYAGLAHVQDDSGRNVRIEFANGGETWERKCKVCWERLAPVPDDEDNGDDVP